MLSDLFDVVSTGYWKLILLFVTMGIGCGLYLWANHERQLSAQKAARKHAEKKRKHNQKVDRLKAHLKHRKELAITFVTRTRRFFLIKTRPKFDGWIEAKGGAGVIFYVARKRKKIQILVDYQGDGLGGKDLVGEIRKTRLHSKEQFSLLQRFDNLAPFPKSDYRHLYKQSFLAAMRALHSDRAHLARIAKLRRSHPAFITVDNKRNGKIAKWKFWKKGRQQLRTVPSKNRLDLITKERRKGYGCKRNFLKPWKKKCKGIQQTQTAFEDRGRPGLNAGDGDRYGVRVLRDGKVYQDQKMRTFERYPRPMRLQLRATYRDLTTTIANALHQNKPPRVRKKTLTGTPKRHKQRAPARRPKTPPQPARPTPGPSKAPAQPSTSRPAAQSPTPQAPPKRAASPR